MTTKSKETVDRRILQLMNEKLGLEKDQIRMEDSFTDNLGIDSLDVVELFHEVEKTFSIRIPDEDAEKLTTVKSLVTYVHTHLS